MDDTHSQEQDGTERPDGALSRELPPDAPEAVRAAADGDDLGEPGMPTGDRMERDALDWLLGATRAPEYECEVEFDTPDGLKPLTFVLRSVDGRDIAKIENEHTKGFGNVDDIGLNAALVAAATVQLIGAKGEPIDPDSERFRGAPNIPREVAMEKRFKYQDGLLSGVAGQVRRLGGWAPDRVKPAKKRSKSIVVTSGGGRREPVAASPAERAMETATGNS